MQSSTVAQKLKALQPRRVLQQLFVVSLLVLPQAKADVVSEHNRVCADLLAELKAYLPNLKPALGEPATLTDLHDLVDANEAKRRLTNFKRFLSGGGMLTKLGEGEAEVFRWTPEGGASMIAKVYDGELEAEQNDIAFKELRKLTKGLDFFRTLPTTRKHGGFVRSYQDTRGITFEALLADEKLPKEFRLRLSAHMRAGLKIILARIEQAQVLITAHDERAMAEEPPELNITYENEKGDEAYIFIHVANILLDLERGDFVIIDPH